MHYVTLWFSTNMQSCLILFFSGMKSVCLTIRASLSAPLRYAMSIKTIVSTTAGWPLPSCSAIRLLGSLSHYVFPYVIVPVCAHPHQPAGRHLRFTTGRLTLRENWREPGVQRWEPQDYIFKILYIQINMNPDQWMTYGLKRSLLIVNCRIR